MPLLQENLTDASSLLGAAQRGQGHAYRELLRVDPLVASDVIAECVTSDPRIDSQLDSRGAYYGSLIAERSLSIERIAQHLHAEPTQDQKFHRTGTELAVEVLTQAALRGHRSARSAVLDYLAVGAHWSEVAHDLATGGDVDSGAAERIAKRFPDDEGFFVAIRDATWEWTDDPLSEWSKLHPRLREAVQRLLRDQQMQKDERKVAKHAGRFDQRPDAPRPSAATAELLDLAEGSGRFAVFRALCASEHELNRALAVHEAQHGTPRRRDAAIRALAARSDVVLLDFAPSMITVGRGDDPDLPESEISGPQFAAYLAVQQLQSPEAIACARDWVMTDNALGHAGWIILINAGEARDNALIRDAFAWLAIEDIYLASSAVDGIHASGRVACLDVVRELFRVSSYDYLRDRCVRALVELDPSYAASPDLIDAMWDASERVRGTVARHIFPTAQAIARLREMSVDPREEDDVRDAARSRLTTVDGLSEPEL